MPYRWMGSALVAVLLWFALVDVGAGQQTAGASSSSSFPAWRSSDETTVGGVIRQVVATNPPNAPMGLNLVMTGSQHALTVNVGRGLSDRLKSLLAAGQTIRVTGIVRSFGGQDYLMARELEIGDQKIQVRSANGFPVNTMAGGGIRQSRGDGTSNGGAR
jgi:hypothetical protein